VLGRLQRVVAADAELRVCVHQLERQREKLR
jgi:hypothetical protein